MRTIEKKCLTRTQKLAIILSSVLVALIIASVVLSIIYANIPTDETETELPTVDEALGESLYHTIPVAYSFIDTANISAVIVRNEKGTFDLTRFPDVNGVFYLGYESPSGDKTTINYLPPVMAEETNFDYESFYAMEENDGYGTIFMLTYLTQAIGTPYFNERIDLPEDKEARDKMLADYGLDDAHRTSVSFTWGERDSEGNYTEKGIKHVYIGDAALNGQGRYFRVGDGDNVRDCIYYTSYNTLHYAELGFESFVKGVVVAEGLDEDKTFEPLLTTDFKEWHNELIESGEVKENYWVIATGDVLNPIKDSDTYTPEKYPSGYLEIEGSELEFKLEDLKGADRDRVLAALVGKNIGVDYSDAPIYITLLTDVASSVDTVIDFGDKDSVKYTYEITAVEAILDAAGNTETRTPGTAVGESSLVLVSYSYYLDGAKQNKMPRHAVIDLNDPLLAGVKDELSAAVIGDYSSAPIDFDITYTKDNAAKTTRKLYVKDIIKIYDANGKSATKIAKDGYATITYYETVNGNKGPVRTMDVVMDTVKEKAGFEALYEVLQGRECGANLALLASETVTYNEAVREFVSSSVTKIDYALDSELIVSLNFCNASNRDPFYGESIYENTTDQYKLYGLNSDNCQLMLRLIGGIDEDSTHSTGLSGTTVVVGLTNKVIKEYGLYKNVIYVELPRGVYDVEIPSEDENEESQLDYYSYSKLGFTLYISDVVYKEDESTGEIKKYRYVGSDMYDLVALVDNEKLEFVDYSFLNFWARKNLILFDLDNAAFTAKDYEDPWYTPKYQVNFFMEDIYGSYDFRIQKDIVYKGSYQGEIIHSLTEFEGYDTTVDWYNVYVKQSEGSMQDTELAKYIASHGTNDKGEIALSTLYNDLRNGGKDYTLDQSIEWVGVSNFMLAYQVLSMTSYEGEVTDEERERASEDNKLMSIVLQLEGKNASDKPYVFEFYRVSDRRVLVRSYQTDSAGNPVTEPSDDFYISTFAFKKLASAYITILNAGKVDVETPYPGE